MIREKKALVEGSRDKSQYSLVWSAVKKKHKNLNYSTRQTIFFLARKRLHTENKIIKNKKNIQ